MPAINDIENESQLNDLTKDCKATVLFCFDNASITQSENLYETFKYQAEYFKDMKFARVNIEKVTGIKDKYEIKSVPCFLIISDTGAVDQMPGTDIPALSSKLNQFNSGGLEFTMVNRLKKIINTAPVMLFMKGDPKTPRCGFSNQIVGILQDLNVEFSSFDILTDNGVREALKVYSEWPTYPQLYINGELIGGLDVVKDMIASGEFQQMLPKKQDDDAEKYKKLVNKHFCMIFMKGDRDAPRCKFSKELMQILNSTGCEFETFDILSDEDVRQGLKVFSNWPTYPQIYVNGEFIGGLDIIKELQEAGELVKTLKGE